MHKFVIPIIALVLLSCTDQGLSPQDRDFNIQFKFGVGGRNELNTFQNTYTKDLVMDGTVTVSLVLSENELQEIEARLVESGFFSFPDTLTVSPDDSLYISIEPHAMFYFRVKHQSTVKTLYWDDSIVPFYTDVRRKKLQDIVVFVSNIITRKPEFLSLPPARGSYR